jgi:hypothetical protein
MRNCCQRALSVLPTVTSIVPARYATVTMVSQEVPAVGPDLAEMLLAIPPEAGGVWSDEYRRVAPAQREAISLSATAICAAVVLPSSRPTGAAFDDGRLDLRFDAVERTAAMSEAAQTNSYAVLFGHTEAHFSRPSPQQDCPAILVRGVTPVEY